jgi:hypothetical protein
MGDAIWLFGAPVARGRFERCARLDVICVRSDTARLQRERSIGL